MTTKCSFALTALLSWSCMAHIGCDRMREGPDSDSPDAVPALERPREDTTKSGSDEIGHGSSASGSLDSSGKDGTKMGPAYTGRRNERQDGQDHFAEVIVRAWPSQAPTEVTFSTDALEDLRSAFGVDFEFQRHNVWAAVKVQITTANVKRMMPRVGATSFHAEVVRVRVSGNEDRQLYAFLLSVAGMNAILEYLEAFEASQ